MEYSDLKHKISAPLVEARDVVLRSTLSDRFLQVFEEQVDLNEPCYLVPGVVSTEVDPSWNMSQFIPTAGKI